MPFYGRDINTGHPETYADLLKLLIKQIPDKNKRDATDLIGAQSFNGRLPSCTVIHSQAVKDPLHASNKKPLITR